MSAITDYQFAIGDGVTTAFNVMNPDGLISDTPVISALYKTDWQGKQLLYTTARTNKILRSQTLQTTWTAAQASVVPNLIAAPDGTTTADFIKEDAALNSHDLSQPVLTTAVNHDFSIYVKAGTRSAILLMNLTAAVGSYFDVANGALGDLEGAPVARSITDMGGGWYRCSITSLCTAAANDFVIYLADAPTTGAFSYQGDGVSGLYAWGAHLAVTTQGQAYIPTVAVAVVIVDYSLAGSTLTLDPAPLDRALLAWTGTDNNAAFNPRQDGTSMSGKFGTQGVV